MMNKFLSWLGETTKTLCVVAVVIAAIIYFGEKVFDAIPDGTINCSAVINGNK